MVRTGGFYQAIHSVHSRTWSLLETAMSKTGGHGISAAIFSRCRNLFKLFFNRGNVGFDSSHPHSSLLNDYFMDNLNLTVERINSLKPLDVVRDEKVRANFIRVYDTLWGEGEGVKAYERESVFFNKILSDNVRLQGATSFSVFTCFIDLAICGLSVESGVRAQCYLIGRNVKVGQSINERGERKDVYEGHLGLSITGYGEIYMRQRAGQIQYADNPVIVYDNDEFKVSDCDGQKKVYYVCNLPHADKRIVAAYMRIVRTDGTYSYEVMYEEDWMRLKDYSEKQNRKWDNTLKAYKGTPNELYTSNNGQIDTGFLIAKLAKHAFKVYPKMRIGKSTELESQRESNSQQEIDDFYGVPPKKEETSFAPPTDMSAGVKAVPETPAAETADDGAF